MKVNGIISFGKVININSDGDSSAKKLKVDKSTYEICKILNSEHSNKYSKENSAKIRAFFQSFLKEYNGKDGICMKQSDNGKIVLLTGRDAKAVEKIQKKSKTVDASTLVERYIRQRLYENNKAGIEDSLDFIEGHKTKSGFSIFNEFKFTHIKTISGKSNDGRIYKSDKENANTLYSIDYDQRVLNLNA